MFFLSVSLCLCGYGELIKAELGKGEAWVGEGVPLYVTLEAPGPFSGTASFDLPEIPETFFIKQGRPTVGSKTVAGQSVMTQRHEFRVYTQQSGEIQIPGIAIRYEAKPDFLSDPEPYEGSTAPVMFKSRRPPGTMRGQIVLTAEEMDVSQQWRHLPEAGEGEAGMVVEREVIRRAQNTTAMLFQPLEQSVPEGVRMYVGSPSVNDKSERGSIVAERIDGIKYQFVRGGEFILPDLEVVWWNGEELVRKVLPGKTISIAAAEPLGEQKQMHWGVLFLLGASVFIVLGTIRAIKKRVTKADALLRRQVERACRSNRPSEAYDVLLGMNPQTFGNGLNVEWDALAKHLYSNDARGWDGDRLLKAFKKESARRKPKSTHSASDLAPLNPAHNERLR